MVQKYTFPVKQTSKKYIFPTEMACGKYFFVLLLYGDGGEEEGGGDAAVDVTVLTVGFFLVSGKGGYEGGASGFDDGVEVEG